jgi:hypothetical protein
MDGPIDIEFSHASPASHTVHTLAPAPGPAANPVTPQPYLN